MSHVHDLPRPKLPLAVRVVVWSLATITVALILDGFGVVDLWSWMR